MARPPLFYQSPRQFFPSLPNLSFGLSSSNHFTFPFSLFILYSLLILFPNFRSRHGVFFEALGSLLSLLHSGARDAYRQFFVDSMSLIQDILYVSSLSVNGSSRSRVTLKCFSDSFSGVEDLPSTNRPVDGRGLLIDLTAPTRWQPFATWILKLVCKSLTEGTLYVEGLIRASFISAACSLLCYGNADLHMACFDFVHIIGMVTNYDAISYYLEFGQGGLPVFRNMAYDSSLGIFLNTLYSSCPEDIVKLTAADLVSVFL